MDYDKLEGENSAAAAAVEATEPEGDKMSGPGRVEETKFWSSGLLSCKIAQCICGYCCLWCQAARLGARMGEQCGLCVGCCFLGALRSRFRTIYGIKGSVCNDSYVSMFCTPCALWQMERELDRMGV